MRLTVKFKETSSTFKVNFGEVYRVADPGSIDESKIIEIVEDYLDKNPPADGTSFETDETLSLENGVLSVNTAKSVEFDNTLPVTSAAVAAQVGNIEVLLKTI